MATINYYLDKPDKNGLAPIHLRINCSGSQIKVSTGKKVKSVDFNKDLQKVVNSSENSAEVNHYLDYLKERANDLLNHSYGKAYSVAEVKKLLNDYITNFKENHTVNIVKEQLAQYGKSYTFVDLFAGAGGFSEGFLQAEVNNKYFNFVAASDINSNCELTHVVRYNYQLGLDTKFLCQDITEADFLEKFLDKIGNKKIDVVCGGPPCQSFSLAGKRKKFDKKDDLFSHYLEVISVLKPKYFVMENVKGILTKEGGSIKDQILKEIKSIIDVNELHELISFIRKLKKKIIHFEFILDCLIKRIEIEKFNGTQKDENKKGYIDYIDIKFRKLTPKIFDYKTSKTDKRISTIRHGFNLLSRDKEWNKLKRSIIKEKDFCNIDNDFYIDMFSQFLTSLDSFEIISIIECAFEDLPIPEKYKNECKDIITSLNIYTYSFDEVLDFIRTLSSNDDLLELDNIIEKLRLYKIEKPLLVNASDYGVPQNRERVLFIGCRKDQKYISEIHPTVNEDQKVTILEALYDLDFVGNNEEAHHYEEVSIPKPFRNLDRLIKKRNINGEPNEDKGKTYAEWCKEGRLNIRFFNVNKPFYVKSLESLNRGEMYYDALHNHKTSTQNLKVTERLEIINKSGSYKKAQTELITYGLSSNKRNYNVLNPEMQSPTIMTIPDDYIHYNSPRSLTVREMARLQSFDDSFVFQGKRSTGGNSRKTDVPQFTLVGNSVPPLLARAIANIILEKII